MNLLHLKYAIEVERQGSISKAAQSLFIAQPNLSNSIKDLEAEVGINIFNRTHRGIEVTHVGREFLGYAKSIIAKVETLESMYKMEKKDMISFNIITTRSSYISSAVASYINKFQSTNYLKVHFKETNVFDVINNVATGNFDLGIYRPNNIHAEYFAKLAHSKGLAVKLLGYAPYSLLMAANHPLANVTKIESDMLSDYIEILYADFEDELVSYHQLRQLSGVALPSKIIYIYERASLMDMLRDVHGSYYWTTSTHAALLEGFKLVSRECDLPNVALCEYLVYKDDKKLSKETQELITIIEQLYQTT
ncbi:LysR family transcriptional regulator [bacterium BFN5]|nr:LysR family transcriptional regulator [bacterium BFN5]